MSETTVQLIPCFLCGNGAEIKKSKKNKPYFICEPCGMQVFVRRENGISKLHELLSSLRNKTVDGFGTAGRVNDLVSLVNKLTQLKAKLRETQDKQGIIESFTGEGSLALAEKAIQQEMQAIENQLKERLKKR